MKKSRTVKSIIYFKPGTVQELKIIDSRNGDEITSLKKYEIISCNESSSAYIKGSKVFNTTLMEVLLEENNKDNV